MFVPRQFTAACFVITACILTGCTKEAPTEQAANTATAPAASALPDSLFLSSAPADAQPLVEVKKTAQPGDKVVLTGRVGGRARPFIAHSAVFFLVDPSLLSCDQLHGDSCPQPWDYCCEAKDNLLAHMATVQIVNEQGKPLAVSLENHEALKPLKTVSIVGTVQEVSDSGNFVVNATGIYVQDS